MVIGVFVPSLQRFLLEIYCGIIGLKRWMGGSFLCDRSLHVGMFCGGTVHVSTSNR